jgi:hypothetical protein
MGTGAAERRRDCLVRHASNWLRAAEVDPIGQAIPQASATCAQV